MVDMGYEYGPRTFTAAWSGRCNEIGCRNRIEEGDEISYNDAGEVQCEECTSGLG